MYIHWIKVSIPKWCDYKTTANGASIMHFFVSIPKWCDYKSPVTGSGNISLTLFQFQNGAIIRTDWANEKMDEFQVSIPKWCDYK